LILPTGSLESLGVADDRKAARLVQVGGQFGQELVVRKPDRNGDADLALDAARDLGQGQRRRPLGRLAQLRARGIRQIEIGLVQGHRLDDRRGGGEDGADLVADALVLGHVGRHDDGVRAHFHGLEHRHRRARPELARDIAGRGDDAAPPGMADDHRLVADRRVVAFLDRGIEGIAVDMRDLEAVELRVGDDALRAAGRTSPALAPGEVQAVSAEKDGFDFGCHPAPRVPTERVPNLFSFVRLSQRTAPVKPGAPEAFGRRWFCPYNLCNKT
jgi:hypothetical protein